MPHQGRKIRVAVLYGGRSGEHEVSLQSAASVIRNLDRDQYEVIPIAIDKQGRWLLNDLSLIESSAKSLPVFANAPCVVLPPNPQQGETCLVPLATGNWQLATGKPMPAIDVVFPVMHGPLCEDGTVQGLLELADVPYVGCGVLASAVGMDKDVSKRLARDAGIPVVPWITIRQSQWQSEPADIRRRASELDYPQFVKPATCGSSVGVHKVKSAADFDAAVNDAFRYDTKLLIEKGIAAREIEFAVLESTSPNEPPMVSTPGEVAPSHEFYSYQAKYLDENGAALTIPAPLTPDQLSAGQRIARDVFQLLECEGMTRVDLFLDKHTSQFYFNEVNTIPGFTQISMYPKLWEASGIPYKELLSRLIQLALARHQRKSALKRDFTP